MMEGRSGSLVFNVMRLTTPLPSSRPGLGAASAEAVAKDSRLSSYPDALLRGVPKWEGEGTACGAGSTCVLPLSMASIYASETFRCLLAMYNSGTSPVTNVTVHVELDNDATTTTLHQTLYDSRADAREILESKACETHVLEAHLPEPGMHILKCTATFIDDNKQIRTFRQFYRFNVLAPFEPSVSVIELGSRLSSTTSTSTSNNNSNSNLQRHFLVELKLLNATPAPIYIESVHIKPMPEYTAKQLTADQQAPGGAPRNTASADVLIDHDNELPYARRASVSAGDTRSFLFLVSRSRDNSDDNHAIRQSASHASISELGSNNSNHSRSGSKNRNSLDSSSTGSGTVSTNGITRRRREIGPLTVHWRSSLGECGVMNGASVAYEPRRKHSDVELAIVAVPSSIVSQHPFVATCCIRNNSSLPVRLYLQVRRDQVSEIVPVGVSGVALPEILPGDTTQCSLSLLPLRPGQHAISGIRVFDMGNKKSYNADPPVITVL